MVNPNISRSSFRALADEVVALRHELDQLKAGQRATQLGNSSIENGYLLVNDAAGVPRTRIGRQVDGKFGWGAVNGDPPPRPNTPTLTPSMNGVVISWTGTFNDITPSDFTNVVAYLSPAGETFVPGESNTVGHFLGAGTLPVSAINGVALAADTDYWCVLIAYNTSGVASQPSFVAGPCRMDPVVASEILDGIVHTVNLADDAVTQAKVAAAAIGRTEIADGSVTTPKVVARAITAGQIAAATILADNMAAGQITARELAALAVTADKMAANSVTAGTIAAGSVTADKLAATLVLASQIIAGDPGGWHLELGDAQTPILFWDGVNTGFAVSRDATSGQSNVFLSGRVEFGNGSQIEQDYVDLAEQPSTGYQTPTQRQMRSWIDSGPKTSVTARWPSATQRGSLILMAVFQAAPPGGATPNCGTPAGSSLVFSQTSGDSRLTLWQVPNSPASRSAETFNSSYTARWAIALVEYTGVDASGVDVYATATGSGTTAGSGTTTTGTAQAAELQFAVFGSPSIGFTNGAGGQWTGPTSGFTKILEGDGVGAQGIAVTTKVADATGPVSTALTANKSVPWIGAVATFRSALAAGEPSQPPDKTVRMFAENRAGYSTPHVIDNGGAVYPLGRMPYCSAHLNASAGYVNVVSSTDLYAQSDWAVGSDPYGMVAISTSGGTYTNITIPLSGLYLVDYTTTWQDSTNTGNPIIGFITRNGRAASTDSIARDSRRWVPAISDGSRTQATRVLPLTAGDVLYWANWQDASGGAVKIFNHRLQQPTEITVTYLGPA